MREDEYGPEQQCVDARRHDWTRSIAAGEGTFVIDVVETAERTKPPIEVWSFEMFGVEEPEELAQCFVDEVVSRSSLRDCYVIKLEKSVVEWGASGAHWSLLIEAAQALIYAGAYDVIKRFVRDRAPSWTSEPLTRDQAFDKARQAVILRFPHDADASSLVLLGETTDGQDAWSFEFQATGSTFTVDVECNGGLTATRVKRETRYDDGKQAR